MLLRFIYVGRISIFAARKKPIFYDEYDFIFIELLNFTKSETELETGLDKWLYALKNMSQLTEIPSGFDEEIFKTLFDTAEYINLTPMERTMYEIRQKIRWDNKNVLDFAIEEAQEKGKRKGLRQGKAEGKKAGMKAGMLEGKKEGKKEGKLEVARILKQEGVSVELIKKSTGLPLAEIEKA